MKKIVLFGSALWLSAGIPSGMAAPNPMTQSASSLKSEQIAPASTPDAAPNLLSVAPLAVQSTEVLNLGAEPRQILRFTPQVGTTQRSTIRLNTTTNAVVDGIAMPIPSFPIIEMLVDTIVNDIGPSGTITSTFTYSDINLLNAEGLPPGMVSAMTAPLQQMIGIQGQVTFDAMGNVQEFDFDFPATQDPVITQQFQQIQDSIKQLSNPLPTEAVGVGATWQIPQTVTINGITLEQTATYTLVGYENNLATLEVSVEQRGQPQSLDGLPGMPPGFSPTIQSLESSGTGITTLDLGQIMPVSVDLSALTNILMTLSIAGNDTTIDMEVSMDMTMVSD